MNARALLFLIYAYPVFAGVLPAQEPGGPCPDVYPDPKVGHYAELQFTNNSGESMLIRFAVVGTETIEGRTHYWIEVISAPPAIGENMVVQMLVPHYPFEHQDLKGYIVKMPGAPARRVPAELLAQIGAQTEAGPGWRQQCASATELGVEQVTVAAGTFSARHYRSGGETEGEVWLADVPFGMVKLIQADGRMELIRHGSDAKSSITETPVDMQPPPSNHP